MHLFCFLLFWESFKCYSFGTTGPIQVGFSAKCTSPNMDFNHIENLKCNILDFRLIPLDCITIVQEIYTQNIFISKLSELFPNSDIAFFLIVCIFDCIILLHRSQNVHYGGICECHMSISILYKFCNNLTKQIVCNKGVPHKHY